MIILMYHDIGESEDKKRVRRPAGAGLYDVTMENFKSQMNFLRQKGFRVVNLADAAGDPSRKVVLTFDDGEMNNFKIALPILREFGYPAYFFVLGNRVGKPGFMGWEELRQLRAAGMVVGSHAMSHRILTALSETDAEHELKESKRLLEANLGIGIDDISIPRGFYNLRILEIAKEAGYKNIFVSGVLQGTEEDCRGRISVMRDWTLSRFEMALTGKVPIREQIFNAAKALVEKNFGTDCYDKFRSGILKILRRG